jgi:hypothetical protein
MSEENDSPEGVACQRKWLSIISLETVPVQLGGVQWKFLFATL